VENLYHPASQKKKDTMSHANSTNQAKRTGKKDSAASDVVGVNKARKVEKHQKRHGRANLPAECKPGAQRGNTACERRQRVEPQ